MTRLIFYCCLFATAVNIASCFPKFLDAKPDNSLVVPTSLIDLQALLDNQRYMNGSSSEVIGGPYCGLLEDGGDDYYVPDDFMPSLLYPSSKTIYVWARDNVYANASQVEDWSVSYRAVFYANAALDGLKKIVLTGSNLSAYNNVKGSALFYRAFAFCQLAQAFAPLYNKTTAATDLGIPLRLTADISEETTRSTLQQSYDQMLSDLLLAKSLLPVSPLYKTRPSLPACYALLARIHLLMQDYDMAYAYADSCLQLNRTLIDFNQINGTQTYPFSAFNSEVLFHCLMNRLPGDLHTTTNTRMDTTLYATYAFNDLRKSLFFRFRESPNRYSFRGSYDGTSFYWTGLATDEMYLTRAECAARLGNTVTAMADLNTLLIARWKTGTFVPFTAVDASDALVQIIRERRKELLCRGLRWSDLRRLNSDSRFAHTLYRLVNGQSFSLAPNDLRYTWPIPNDVIALTGMEQNPR